MIKHVKIIGGLLAFSFLFAGVLKAQEMAITNSPFDHENPHWSPDGNWIVYSRRDTTTYWQIFKVSPGGGAEIALTHFDNYHWDDAYDPKWSPDGNWIMYIQDTLGSSQICKIPSSGGTPVLLTSDSCPHSDPQWSPDGNWILYLRVGMFGQTQIYKVSSTGGTEVPVTMDSCDHQAPQWSPDGNWIVYKRGEQIYKISSNGGEEIPLTPIGSYYEGDPQWSPDGNWIAYERYDTTHTNQIYKVSSAGGAEIALTFRYGYTYPQWSPDGAWIMALGGRYNWINIIPAEGGTPIAIDCDGCFWDPRWSPDGNWIVYSKRDTTGHEQIYMIPSPVGIDQKPSIPPDICSLEFNPIIAHTSGVNIKYNVSIMGKLSLKIYDATGKLVKVLINREIRPGNYTVRWDGTNYFGKKVPSGYYLVKLKSGKFGITKKVLVMR